MKKTEVAVKEKSSVDVSVAGQHDWSILGKSVVKKDTMEKIMGSAKFAEHALRRRFPQHHLPWRCQEL